MALQFAPPPQIGQPQNLVPEIKVQPVARQQVPLRSIPYRDRQKEKDERRDMLLALALGSGGGELIGKGLTSLIGKIPGVDQYFEDVEVSGPTPGATRADFEARAMQMGLGPVETKAFVDASLAAEAIPEYSRARPAQTRPSRVKTALEGILSLAPAAALKTPEGAKTFAELQGRRQTAQATAETTKASNLQKAEAQLREQRAAMVKAGRAAYLADTKETEYYGFNPNTNKPVRRRAIDIRGDRFVISQGDTTYDYDSSNTFVPKGELYLNPQLTANTGDKAREVKSRNNYIGFKDGEIFLSRGSQQLVPNEDGSMSNVEIIDIGYNGQPMVNDGSWLTAPASLSLEEYRQAVKEAPEEVTNFYADLASARGAAMSTLGLTSTVIDLVEESPTGTTLFGALLAQADTIQANINAFNNSTDGGKAINLIKQSAVDGDDRSVAQLARLDAELAIYLRDPNDPQVADRFIKSFDRIAGNINDSSGTSSFGGGKIQLFSDAFKGSASAAATDRARILALQLQLAYRAAATSGQTGRTLSDKDLAFFLDIVGYGESSPEVLKSKLYDFSKTLIRDFDDGTENENISKAASLRKDSEALYDSVVSQLKVPEDLLDKALGKGTKSAEEKRKAQREVRKIMGKNSAAFAPQFFIFKETEDGKSILTLATFEDSIRFNGYGEAIDHELLSLLDRLKTPKKRTAGQTNVQVTPAVQATKNRLLENLKGSGANN